MSVKREELIERWSLHGLENPVSDRVATTWEIGGNEGREWGIRPGHTRTCRTSVRPHRHPTCKVRHQAPASGSYERLVAGLKRQAVEVQQKIIGLPPAAGHSQGKEPRAALASLMKKLDSLPADLDSLRSATDRLTRQYFFLGLACVVPVGILGGFLAYLLGWS